MQELTWRARGAGPGDGSYLALALDWLPWGGRVARDNTNATAHARLPTVVPVLLGGAPCTVPETRETQKVLPPPRSPCRRGRWGSARRVRSKLLVRVECRLRAPVVKSFESPVGQRGTRTMIMGHGGGGGAPVRMEQHPNAPKGIRIPLMGPPASTCLLTSLPLTYRPTTGPSQPVTAKIQADLEAPTTASQWHLARDTTSPSNLWLTKYRGTPLATFIPSIPFSPSNPTATPMPSNTLSVPTAAHSAFLRASKKASQPVVALMTSP